MEDVPMESAVKTPTPQKEDVGKDLTRKVLYCIIAFGFVRAMLYSTFIEIMIRQISF